MTTGFLKSIREITQRYVQEVEQESQQFAAAIHAVRNATAPAATSSIEQRLNQLEQNYQRQLQKTVAGLSEDIGDLDSRLAAIEREQREEEPWASWPAGESLAESLHNVVVIDPPVVDNSSRNIVVHMNDEDVDMGSSALETKTVEIKQVQGKPTVSEVKPVAVTVAAPAVVAEVKPTVAAKQMEDAEEDAEEEEEEEEEEGLELEEFTFNGDSYYKDTDNNVYTANEEGEVEETPIGRWLEKRQTIKFYTA